MKIEDSNYLSELDQITQEIINTIIDAQNNLALSEVIVPKTNQKVPFRL